MSLMEDAQIAALKSEFEQSRAKVWADESVPLGKRQAEVDRLWREFDARRTELREAMTKGELPAGASPGYSVSPITGRPMIFPRKRRRPWK